MTRGKKAKAQSAGRSKAKASFADAVAAAPQRVASALQKGKQALSKEHRAQVLCKDEARWTGSIDLDAALAKVPEHASANRWDYGLGYQGPEGLESALWVEVHPAETGEVSTVIRKLRWLEDYLPANCPELWALTRKAPEELRFVWVASGRYAILPNSPQLRALRAAGLDPPVPRLLVP
ncbi:hypothetical protein [Polyangium aurulentum]|uniref:hypothetical protein n=1 Tax=Polyangium aurulentum TaxID=2567896 RepID=UPI0010ADE4C9|nr:hypothetical protein [Polyangium aurulentum]UQA55528.1 hypothetical protein E8A73_029805 [Polyangium aurulentum]